MITLLLFVFFVSLAVGIVGMTIFGCVFFWKYRKNFNPGALGAVFAGKSDYPTGAGLTAGILPTKDGINFQSKLK